MDNEEIIKEPEIKKPKKKVASNKLVKVIKGSVTKFKKEKDVKDGWEIVK